MQSENFHTLQVGGVESLKIPFLLSIKTLIYLQNTLQKTKSIWWYVDKYFILKLKY